MSFLAEAGARRRWFWAGLGAAGWCAGFIGVTACSTTPLTPPPAPLLTPPVVLIRDNPWLAGERVAATVPDSTLMIGHGASMLPLYPNGTVLVLQAVKWEHLRRGMTVVFSPQIENPFAAVGHVLREEKDGAWETQGLNNNVPDVMVATRENYIGVVVAAFCRADSVGSLAMLTQVAEAQQATCLLRCHVPELNSISAARASKNPENAPK